MGIWYDYSGINATLKSLSLSHKGILGSSFNADFTFSSQSFDSLSYDDSGSAVVNSSSIAITLKAKLAPKKDVNNNINIGSPQTGVYLEGYLVGNQNYRGNLPMVVNCTIKNEQTTITGTFHSILSLDNSTTEDGGYRLATGSVIKGYFQTDGNLPI